MDKKLILECGGLSIHDLIAKLKNRGVLLNEFAELILLHNSFTTSAKKYTVSIVEQSVEELGLNNGGSLLDIKNSASNLGLHECPLEVAPYLRMIFIQQKEIIEKGEKNRNPPGALVVLSKPLIDDDRFPKGFYLRNIDGSMWLRGYRCSATDYIWTPTDRFVFQI